MLLEDVLWFSPSWQERTMWLLHCPSLQWRGEENMKKKAKLLGRLR